MAKFIQNLDGFVWVNQGRPDPITGEIAQTRYAVNLLSGERLNVRQAQTAQHGGVPYEKRAPARASQPGATTPPPAGQPAAPAPAAPTRKEYKLRPLSPQGQSNLEAFIRTQAAQGNILTERQARQSEKWKQINRALRYKSNKSTGKKAQTVRVDLGRGSAEWDWDLGDTPDEEDVA